VPKRFRGESVHKVDSKGRVSIPAPFRRVLEEGDPDWQPGANPNLVIVYGIPGQKCLEGYSIRAMEGVDEEISKLPRFSKARRAVERMINTQSIYAQVDENGRMVLPARLRNMIGVTGEATFAGMGEKFQIWQPQAYEDDMAGIGDWMEDQGEEQNPFALLDQARQEG